MLVPVQYQRLMDRPDFDQIRSEPLSHEVLHQCAVLGGVEGGHPEALAWAA